MVEGGATAQSARSHIAKLLTAKVGLTRFHPTSRDKSDKMRDKQKALNNFPTTLFIKNWLSSKCI